MAAFAPIPNASDSIATTVTNGVLNNARSESLRLRMAAGVRDLGRCKPIGGRRSLRVDETLLLIREFDPKRLGFYSRRHQSEGRIAIMQLRDDVSPGATTRGIRVALLWIGARRGSG